MTFKFKLVIISLLISNLISSLTSAQDSISPIAQELTYDTSYFINPVGHKIVLAGSFGELRSNHFHSGIDIKPKKHNTTEPIMSAAGGYISRVKIQRGGYGRALYINHPNGYTTVYAHMIKFSDTLEQHLEKIQYDLESFEVDIYLQPNDFIVNQGEIIGMMGSTGRSYGKHLHFEIRETESEIPINPILFGQGPSDHKSPLINSLLIHSLDPDMGIIRKNKFQTIGNSKGKYSLANKVISIPAWTVGIAVHSFDKMDGANNTNGIYSLKMYVDDSLYYGFELDKISFDETFLINGHIDFQNKIKENNTYQQCYQLPGNTLSIYNQKGNGTIKLFKNKARKIYIEAADLAGNISTLSFQIKRDPEMKDNIRPEYNYSVNYDKQDTLVFGNIEVIIPIHTMYKKHYIKCSTGIEKNEFSIAKNDIPLRKYYQITVKGLPNDSISNKRCIAYKKKGTWISYGGTWDGTILKTNVRRMGEFKVIIDNTKPSVNATKFPQKLKSNSIVQLKVSDNLETKGSAKPLKIDVYIDGKWKIFQYKVMTKIVEVNLSELSKGTHEFILRAEDDRRNIQTFKKSFNII